MGDLVKGPWIEGGARCATVPDEVCSKHYGCVGCPAEGDDSFMFTEKEIRQAQTVKFPVDLVLPMGQGDGEIRVTDATTGGEKGKKLARYDLIPVGPLRELAKLYGKGAEKYAERNWERGYDWSLSYAALQRHANAFWSGEDMVPDMEGVHHLTAVAWHAFALLQFMKTHKQGDDRSKQQS